MFEKLAEDIQAMATEKLANKLRGLQRLGKLDRKTTELLLSKGMLPSSDTVMRGIERGNSSIRSRHGIQGLKEFSEAITRDNLSRGRSAELSAINARNNLDDISASTTRWVNGARREPWATTDLYSIVKPGTAKKSFEGAVPSERAVLRDFLKAEGPDGYRKMDALIERHELDEAKSTLRAIGKIRSTGKSKSILQERRSNSGIIPDSDIEAVLGGGQGHASPEVIANEYMNLRQLFPLSPDKTPTAYSRGKMRDYFRGSAVPEISNISRGGAFSDLNGISPRAASGHGIGDARKLLEGIDNNMRQHGGISEAQARQYTKLKELADSALTDYDKFSPVDIAYKSPKELIRYIRSLEDSRLSAL